LSDSDDTLNSEDLRSAFDRTFQEARVELSHELVHLLVVRIGMARFALKVGDLAGLARAQTIVPIPAADSGLLGLAALKGKMVAVYSLGARIGSPMAAAEPERSLVLCRSDREIALAFSAAEGTMMIPSSELWPAGAGAPEYATGAVGAGSARLWLLNVSAISAAITLQTRTPAPDLRL
jgi:chemotaxis signal transduction protein